MVKSAITLFCLFFITINGYTQPMHRYKDLLFAEVIVDKDLSYTTDRTVTDKNVLYDLYQPKTDDTVGRPLIIWMHGGGFKYGSKNATEVQLWCKTFAQRGYVCAAVNYRLSKHNPLFSETELRKSCADAVDAVKQMVTYFKRNAARYGIDTNKIVLAGNSAGGITALQAAYGTDEGLAQLAGLKTENAAYGQSVNFKVAAVISFWGAMFDTNWLKNARVPIVMVHGRKDRVVSIDHRNSPMYGSLVVHSKADSLHLPNALKVYDNYAHQLQRHFNPFFAGKATKQRWLEAGQFAADFLYEKVFKAEQL